MKKILLVDYYGTCDAQGRAIGHSPKVLEEYRELLCTDYHVSAAVSSCIASEVSEDKFEKLKKLNFNIVEEGKKSIYDRIVDKYKLIRNIRKILKEKKNYDIIWFYRTDFFMFLYFLLHRKIKACKIYCLVCQQSFGEGILGKILTSIYDLSLQKFDGIIYTQKNKKPKHKNCLYIPDYYYDEAKYGKYRKIKKEEKVICLGTMSPYKKIDKLIALFNKLQYPLEISGYFFEKDRFDYFQKIAEKNIVLNDIILDQNEYYMKLAEARYAILPYDMEQYKDRTSGVLQECIFLGTIPIAPRRLLEINEIDGIGYGRLEEITLDIFNQNKMFEEHFNVCEKKDIQKRLCDFLMGE